MNAAQQAVWKADHDLTCDDGEPHEWTEHLPWDTPDDEAFAAEWADAVIAAVRSADAAPAPREEEFELARRHPSGAWIATPLPGDGAITITGYRFLKDGRLLVTRRVP